MIAYAAPPDDSFPSMHRRSLLSIFIAALLLIIILPSSTFHTTLYPAQPELSFTRKIGSFSPSNGPHHGALSFSFLLADASASTRSAWRASTSSSTVYGPDNFGDLMSDAETNTFVNGNFTALERIVLTANGNLQRILSSYYGAPITIRVTRCERLDEITFDREVDILMGEEIVCTAVGLIEIYSSDCLTAVESKTVGIGQLFRYLRVLPSFRLLKAGKSPRPIPAASKLPLKFYDEYAERVGMNDPPDIAEGERLWREYELASPQLKCHFLEVFAPNFLDFSATRYNQAL